MTPRLLALFAFGLAAARGADVPLTVDTAHSRIDYSVTATVDSFIGNLPTYTLDLAADSANGGSIVKAALSFKITDLTSKNAKRDTQMQEWANAPQFATCTFVLSSLTPDRTPGRYLARGNFSFHGMSRELSFPVSIAHSSDGLWVIDGDVEIDTRDHGLPIIRKFGVLKVDPKVKVILHLQARAASN